MRKPQKEYFASLDMKYAFFLQPFIVSFAISIFFLVAFIFLNQKKSPEGVRNSERHIHNKNISRFGGAALILSFVVAILLDRRLEIGMPLFGVIISSIAILFFGIIDDLKELSWKVQLFFQITIVAFIYCMGVRLEYVGNPFGGIILFNSMAGYIFGFFLTVVWVVFIMNAINWIDGIDGASSGVAIICTLAIFFLSLKPEVNQPPIGIITAALLGGLVAFLLLNFHPAKILAGTSGSMFLGFVLAVLAIFAGAKIATTLLVLAIPVVDALWVAGERYSSKKSVFAADKRHLHFKLLELGWPQWKISIFYFAVTGIIAALALNTRAVGKTITFILFAVAMISILFYIKNKTSNTNA